MKMADARIYALFPQFFFTEKAIPQTFSLLECMPKVEQQNCEKTAESCLEEPRFSLISTALNFVSLGFKSFLLQLANYLCHRHHQHQDSPTKDSMTASTSPVTRFFAFNPSLDTLVFPQLSLSGLKDICVDYLEVRNVGRQSLESIPRYIKMMRQTYCYLLLLSFLLLLLSR